MRGLAFARRFQDVDRAGVAPAVDVDRLLRAPECEFAKARPQAFEASIESRRRRERFSSSHPVVAAGDEDRHRSIARRRTRSKARASVCRLALGQGEV